MVAAPIKRPPQGLGAHGRALWRSVLEKYGLTPAEMELLHTLCSASHQLYRINLAIKGSQHLVSTGSQGQLVGHPLLAEARAHAETVRRLY